MPAGALRPIVAPMREIVFDTETTGLDPRSGDRMVEIGCIEMVNRVPTGRTFHAYFNPDRPMPLEAEQVHGLGDAFPTGVPVGTVSSFKINSENKTYVVDVKLATDYRKLRHTFIVKNLVREEINAVKAKAGVEND